MMKLIAFFALLAVGIAKPTPGGLIAYSAPVVAAAPITHYTAVHTPAVVHTAPALSVHPAPLVATYAAVPTHTYVSGYAVHAPIEHHGYKIVY